MEIDVSLLIFNFQMWKAAFTELLATAFLVFTLTTTIISILDSHEVEPKLLVPLAIFLILFLFFMMTVPLSGGHMNPILTFIAALKGLITLARAAVHYKKFGYFQRFHAALKGLITLACAAIHYKKFGYFQRLKPLKKVLKTVENTIFGS